MKPSRQTHGAGQIPVTSIALAAWQSAHTLLKFTLQFTRKQLLLLTARQAAMASHPWCLMPSG